MAEVKLPDPKEWLDDAERRNGRPLVPPYARSEVIAVLGMFQRETLRAVAAHIVEACAHDCEINKRECANKSVCHLIDATSIRALLVEETVGEDSHE